MVKKYGIKRCVYVPNRSSPLVLVHWPNMWWTVSKGAANQSAFKVQNRQHEGKKQKTKPILWLGAFGPSNNFTDGGSFTKSNFDWRGIQRDFGSVLSQFLNFCTPSLLGEAGEGGVSLGSRDKEFASAMRTADGSLRTEKGKVSEVYSCPYWYCM